MSKNQHLIKLSLRELKKHVGTMDKFFTSASEALQIRKGKVTKKNLWKILLLDIQSRGGPQLNAADIKALENKFFRTIDLEKAKKLEGEEKFKCLYSSIVGLPRIGPKITSVFMKNMACKCSIYPKLKDYLFLPIDVHIENILTKKLQVFKGNEISKDNPFKSNRSKLFQVELSNIHNPRVELDDFWYVGYLFCNKKSELVCKELCWIRKYCQQKFIT